MKLLITLIVFGLIAAGGFYVKSNPSLMEKLNFKFERSKVEINGRIIEVEISDTEEKRKKGLSQRDNLAQGKGMLFIFDREGVYSFWMKDTKIPLDMIWINNQNKIVYIKESAQPCLNQVSCPSYSNSVNAKYVLEVNAGFSNNNLVKVGDTVLIDLLLNQ